MAVPLLCKRMAYYGILRKFGGEFGIDGGVLYLCGIFEGRARFRSVLFSHKLITIKQIDKELWHFNVVL